VDRDNRSEAARSAPVELNSFDLTSPRA